MRKNTIILCLIISCLFVVIGAILKLNHFFSFGNILMILGIITFVISIWLLCSFKPKNKKQQENI
jgi:NhaP-type Na+/H+ or K+/H+ antiporter